MTEQFKNIKLRLYIAIMEVLVFNSKLSAAIVGGHFNSSNHFSNFVQQKRRRCTSCNHFGLQEPVAIELNATNTITVAVTAVHNGQS